MATMSIRGLNEKVLSTLKQNAYTAFKRGDAAIGSIFQHAQDKIAWS